MHRDTLTISGEKAVLNGGVAPDAFHRSERSAGRFTRTIKLHIDVEAEGIKADYKNGLLLVTLPKAEQAKPKSIPSTVHLIKLDRAHPRRHSHGREHHPR
jgi:HSP20 family protein